MPRDRGTEGEAQAHVTGGKDELQADEMPAPKGNTVTEQDWHPGLSDSRACDLRPLPNCHSETWRREVRSHSDYSILCFLSHSFREGIPRPVGEAWNISPLLERTRSIVCGGAGRNQQAWQRIDSYVSPPAHPPPGSCVAWGCDTLLSVGTVTDPSIGL